MIQNLMLEKCNSDVMAWWNMNEHMQVSKTSYCKLAKVYIPATYVSSEG